MCQNVIQQPRVCSHWPFAIVALLPPANKVGGKVIFSQLSVIPSVHRGFGFPACITGHITRGVSASGGSASRGDVWGRPPEMHGILQDMVNKRAVCILLECILVVRWVYSVSKCLEMIGLHLTPGSTVTVWFMPNIAELLKPSTVKDFIFGQCELTIKLSIRAEHLFFFVVVSTVDLSHIV